MLNEGYKRLFSYILAANTAVFFKAVSLFKQFNFTLDRRQVHPWNKGTKNIKTVKTFMSLSLLSLAIEKVFLKNFELAKRHVIARSIWMCSPAVLSLRLCRSATLKWPKMQLKIPFRLAKMCTTFPRICSTRKVNKNRNFTTKTWEDFYLLWDNIDNLLSVRQLCRLKFYSQENTFFTNCPTTYLTNLLQFKKILFYLINKAAGKMFFFSVKISKFLYWCRCCFTSIRHVQYLQLLFLSKSCNS